MAKRDLTQIDLLEMYFPLTNALSLPRNVHLSMYYSANVLNQSTFTHYCLGHFVCSDSLQV